MTIALKNIEEQHYSHLFGVLWNMVMALKKIEQNIYYHLFEVLQNKVKVH